MLTQRGDAPELQALVVGHLGQQLPDAGLDVVVRGGARLAAHGLLRQPGQLVREVNLIAALVLLDQRGGSTGQVKLVQLPEDAVDNGIQIMSNLSSPGSSEINIDTTGHAYIGGGSDLQMRAGSNGNNPILIDGTPVTMTHTAIIGGGLALGDTTMTPPAAGRILMKQSTGATTVPAGAALLYLENQANNKQTLWIRFDDGTYVKLAESAS